VDIYKTPLLTARETARALDIPESSLDRWLADPSGDPLVHAVEPERRSWPRVPFVGIVEAHVLRALREFGMDMPDIRRAVDIVRKEFDDPYALASRRIATDGADVFVRLVNEDIIQARDHQRAIPEVIAEYLQYVSWDDAGRPGRLTLRRFPTNAAAIIDPRFGWGAPVFASTKVPVKAMVDLWRVGETIAGIAEEFDLDAATVESVLRQAA
jgi:uncharacterized protein (DUF433 family)